MTKILGIDPGFGRVGWGVIEKKNGEWFAVDWGCLETSSKKDFIERLKEIHSAIGALIKKYQPEKIGVEDLFFAKNVKTAMKVGEARGVILLTCVQAGVPVSEFTPLQIKQTVTGYGRAEKGQMQKMVQLLLKIKKKITPDDAADALAAALTCGVSYGLLTDRQ